ncbi:unnamed protein product [Durusdinium trenchii]|uniref:PDZ domain-containing protein n=1 Tax=Durusdinium trenchii TaxID=1381693 RepID=A0ABP0QFC8_9DINO
MFLPGSPRQASGDTDLGTEFGQQKDTSRVRESASLRVRPPPVVGGNVFTFTPPQDVRLPTEVSPKHTRLVSQAVDRPLPDVATQMSSVPRSAAPLASPAPAAKASASPKRRICLQYHQDDNPRSDLLTLGGGQGTPVVVQMIAAGGRAEQAGVKPGAIITAINGSTAFQSFPAWQVRAIIQPPATVEIEQEMQLSPASPRCKEIRLTRKSELQLGIAPKSGAWHPKDSVMLAEEVVFKPRAAPLWLSSLDRQEGRPTSPIYELRRPEAHRLVNQAVRTAWDTVSKQADQISRVPRGARQRSSSPYCGLETCLPQWSTPSTSWKWDPGPAAFAQNGSSGAFSPRAPQHLQGRAPPWSTSEAGAPPQLPLSSRGAIGADPDSSPLRWVSPVFAPFFGYSNACSPQSRGGGGPRSPSPSPRNRSSSPKPRKARGDLEEVVDPENPNAGVRVMPDDDDSSGILLQHQL